VGGREGRRGEGTDVETIEALARDFLQAGREGGREGGVGEWMTFLRNREGREGGREGGLTLRSHSPATSACCRPRSVRRHLEECRRRNSPREGGMAGGMAGGRGVSHVIFTSPALPPSLPPSLPE
jgi:hypothetical protein